MDVTAQWVRTGWTKRSRGMPGAGLRNAAPQVFPMPAHTGTCTHVVTLDEQDDFQPHHELHAALPGGVELREQDGRLRVRLTLAERGAPPRLRRPPAVRLEPGDWLRWRINYRFAWLVSRGHAWTYRLDTLNLAYGPGADFTGDPAWDVDERGTLR